MNLFRFGIAILPVFLLLRYIYNKDSHKEPFDELVGPFVLGFLSVIPIAFCELILGLFFDIQSSTTTLGLFISVFVGVALVEEFFKWLIVKKGKYKSKHFDESYDAIVYSVYSSLGMATLENIMYVCSSGIGLITGLFRFFTAIPSHTIFGIIMGVYFAEAKRRQMIFDTKGEKKYLRKAILMPALVHTIYDFLIFHNSYTSKLIWLVFLIASYVMAVKTVNSEALNNTPFAQNTDDQAKLNENSDNSNYVNTTFESTANSNYASTTFESTANLNYANTDPMDSQDLDYVNGNSQDDDIFKYL